MKSRSEITKEQARNGIEAMQAIQQNNPPTSDAWQRASRVIHELATILNDGVEPKDARGRIETHFKVNRRKKPMARKATYERMKQALCDALNDLTILAGEKVGPNDTTWQDVAGTAAVNLEVLASQLKEAHVGNCESFISFPSPSECLENEPEVEEPWHAKK